MSMYRFWRYGSDRMVQSNQGTIKDYIHYIKTNSDLLIDKFTKDVHYHQQIRWIPENTWSRAIVLKYQPDMTRSSEKLLEHLGISQKSVLEHKNVSKGQPELLDHEDLNWIRDYYKSDFELWDSVNNHPELFKKVI